MRTGDVSLGVAEQVSRLPKEDQERVIEADIATIKQVSTAVPILENIKKMFPEVAEKVLALIVLDPFFCGRYHALEDRTIDRHIFRAGIEARPEIGRRPVRPLTQ